MPKTSAISTAVTAAALALVLGRAGLAVREEILPRLEKKSLAALGRSLAMTPDERDRRTFGAYTEAFTLLDRQAPSDGIVSIAGLDPANAAEVNFFRALRTNLYGRLVRRGEELEDYLIRRHPDRLDARVFMLRFLPSEEIAPEWRALLDVVLERPKFVIYRVKGPVR